MHLPITAIIKRTTHGLILSVFSENAHDDIPIDPDHLKMGDELSYPLLLSSTEKKTGPTPPSRAMRKKARKNELKIARDIGGRAQPNSGAVAGMKGDVRKHGEFRVEGKTTTSKQFIITRHLLDKIRGECGLNEKPAFVIFFANKRTLQEEDSWVLLPYEEWNATHLDR